MKDILLEKLSDIFQSHRDLNTVFETKKIEVDKQKESLGKITSLDIAPKYEDIESFYLTSYVDLMAFSQDLQILFFKFGNYADLYKETFLEDIPEEMRELYKVYKAVIKTTFVMKDGNLVEIEDGALDKKRQDFLKGDFYQKIKSTFS